MPKTELNPCDVCSLRTTNEFNFLLNCRICQRGFHHRCCKPPIPDEVLTSLIKATLKDKPGKGVKFWKCYDCREDKVPVASTKPEAPSRPTSSASKKRKQDEVIVISDDDNTPEPNKEIVVSGRPPARIRDDSQRETKHHVEPRPIPEPAQHTAAESSKSDQRHKPQDRDMDIDRHDDPGPSQPSTSRFGLLSPPASISGTSTRYTSATPTPFHFDDNKPESDHGPSETVPGPGLDPNVLTQAIPPTPPISARTVSPLVHAQELKPPAKPTLTPAHEWTTPIIQQDLRLLSKEFKDTYHSHLATSQPTGCVSSVRGRKPRKPIAKQLDKNARTLSQYTYFHFWDTGIKQ